MAAHCACCGCGRRVCLILKPPIARGLVAAQGMAQARFTLVGRMALIAEAEQAAAREAFLGKNPGSFWVRARSKQSHPVHLHLS